MNDSLWFEGHARELLTTDELAQLLRTTRKAVYAMAERGQLPGTIRVGKRLRYRSRAIYDWLEQQEERPRVSSQAA
ncbi:MAG TPA: helix-turn-helix domain-containing protein [Vicinamibacterales bacterium]|nr:helix-turn-helix domain-containing protein [Vicinamibacterales bacterium]